MSEQKLRGYRTLTPREVELANKVSQLGDQAEKLLGEIRECLLQVEKGRDDLAYSGSDWARWLSISKTHLQQGLMAAKRAITRPETFS